LQIETTKNPIVLFCVLCGQKLSQNTTASVTDAVLKAANSNNFKVTLKALELLSQLVPLLGENQLKIVSSPMLEVIVERISDGKK